jgi:hypothetical protein
MGRRELIAFLLMFSKVRANGLPLRGELVRTSDGKPALKTKDGRLVRLEGDSDTEGVLNDERLKGADFEVIGKPSAPDVFVVGPIHEKSMWVHRDGKRLSISYWCELCSIRNYTPGKCQCCQEETELQLREVP